MKKVFSILAFAVFSLSAIAQSTITKGNKLVEGTVSYSNVKSTGTDYTEVYSITPSIGYMITNKFAVGVTGEFAKSTNVTAPNSVTKTTTTNFGAYGRCYFLNVGKNLKVYSQLNLGRVSDNIGSSRFNTNLGLGANYFVTKKLALSANLTQLVSYTSGYNKYGAGWTSTWTGDKFTAGFTGVSNPFSTPSFGVLYKF